MEPCGTPQVSLETLFNTSLFQGCGPKAQILKGHLFFLRPKIFFFLFIRLSVMCVDSSLHVNLFRMYIRPPHHHQVLADNSEIVGVLSLMLHCCCEVIH